ncbi:flocculation protein FLO11-like [Magnolia sinica]|uniref:flocculation protein FLO11-like n=1 Tax=Magnolia sinica TaxID=86752 RepID=UPI00265852FC|nr:flocculation protein FLO11-like [Magnolia sinica]
MEEEPKKNLDICGSLSLIDFSFEDDSLLIPTSSDRLRDQQSSGLSENHNGHHCIGGFEAESAQEGDNIPNLCKEMEEAPVLEPSEPTRIRRAGKCNLRKSLAWDSAFFTSEGILDPDELEVVSKTFKKSAAHALPEIQEDLRKSTESTCTLGSDASALESLEIELFEDIRASIQKSGYECSNASNVASSSSKTRQGELDIPCIGASPVEHTCQNRMKPVSKPLSSSKSHGLTKQVLEKNSKEALVHPLAGVARSGDQNSSLKPPKILPRVNPPSTAPTKKTLASSECIKVKNNTAKASGSGSNQKYVALSKKPVSGVTPATTSSSIPSAKSSSSGSSSSAKTLPSTPSSHNRSGSTKNLRNRADSRNANPSSTVSIMKTPLRISRNKTGSRNSNLSAYLMSTSKFESSVSPASSIDGLSSESSSSTCTASQMSNSSKASLDISSTSSSCGGDFLVRDAPEQPDQPFIGHEDSVAGFPSQCVEKASMETGVLSHLAAVNAPRSCINSNSSMQSFRPSGLRMPSPKIGFFDAEKTGVRTSNTGLQFNSGLRSGLLKNASGINNVDGAIKQRPSKLQYARPLAQIGSMKFNSQLIGPSRQASASSMKPASTQQPQQLPNPLPSSIPRTKNHPSTVVAVQGSSLGTGGGSNSNTLELQAEAADKGKYGQSSDPNTGEHDDRNVIEMYEATESERQVHSRVSEIDFTKENGHCRYAEASHELDVKNVDNSKLIYHSGECVQDQKVDFLQGLSEPSSFSNRSILAELNTELAVKKVVDKTSMFPFLEKGIQVPSPVAYLDPAVELVEANLTAKSLNEPEGKYLRE